MSTKNPTMNNHAGAIEPQAPVLRVIVDYALGDEALSFTVPDFRANCSPEDLEVELMSQLCLNQAEAALIARDICRNGSVFLMDCVAFELFSQHGSFAWPDEHVE
jgi:hypothetical protein